MSINDPLMNVSSAKMVANSDREFFRELVKDASADVDKMLGHESIDPRSAALAKTKLEEAELWITRGVFLTVENLERG